MKLVLDQTACQGYGMCQEAAPELLDLDDWGYAGLLGDGEVAGPQHAQAQEAVSVCPVAALKVQT
jgi:ferredoxin